MTIHTYRYRYTAEVEITVDDEQSPQQQPVETANQAMADHADRLLEDDSSGLEGPEVLSPGVLGEVVKMGTWDHIA
jgi:hypothetical protein